MRDDFAGENPLQLAPCPHLPPCPGCPAYGVSLAEKAAVARLQALARQEGVELGFMSGPPLAYRHRARLAVRGRASSPKVGIFELGSHRIVDIPRCTTHHPLINDVAAAVRQAARKHGVEPYREQGHRGRLRYLQVQVSRSSATAQVVVVSRDESAAPLAPFFDTLMSSLEGRLHSLFWSGQTSAGNAILGPRCETVHGPDALVERLGGAAVFFPPDAFAQANMPLFARVVEAIHELVPSGQRVLELYAGVGAIGLGLAARSQRLVCNEIASGSLRGLAKACEALADDQRARVRIRPGAVEACVDELPHADVVIADPPRRGMDATVVSALTAHPPKHLVYLSCGIDSFMRDAQALIEGGLGLERLTAIDMFPNTDHVETLAVFGAR